MTKNSEMRDIYENEVRLDKRMSAAVIAHPTARRWEYAAWSKGYVHSSADDVVVHYADGTEELFMLEEFAPPLPEEA